MARGDNAAKKGSGQVGWQRTTSGVKTPTPTMENIPHTPCCTHRGDNLTEQVRDSTVGVGKSLKKDDAVGRAAQLEEILTEHLKEMQMIMETRQGPFDHARSLRATVDKANARLDEIKSSENTSDSQ